ncbi:NmrA-like family domain-containing protein-like protein [Emericellopsis cladophorae]|uniref:NmrA-like family domain-containing protein-like protein n=1 Tax=Emericellopsis cladophorae TaxID=2686198 RepID=A0A9P9Y6V4_9HYPO|nr:NmrA-like family domain-containing protein-like protein [Emericellopsis cladophorae]KAI6784599.1 NmrA-like family domain-containing protein-like protein [Emericellopsis cladophorae]
MSAPKKVIAVVGATGIQGGSVVKAFLPMENWTVRALTRDPSSKKARELASQGCEVVEAELADPASLARAFEGVAAIFSNTDFWAPYSQANKAGETREKATAFGFQVEFSHAKNVADEAAKVPGLERFVYSALGPMKKASRGKYPNSGHWDSKAEAVDYIEESCPDLQGKVSFVYPSVYHTNPFLLPHKYPHIGDYAIMLPGDETMMMPVIHTDVTFGKFVRNLIVDEEPGVKLLACDVEVTMREVTDTWNRVTGQKATITTETEDRMHELTGLPYEVLDGPAYLAEYDFMHGVTGKVIRPKELKVKVETMTLEEIMQSRGLDALLSIEHPDL